MTKEETLQLLAVLKAAYPASYSNMTKREANGTVAVWYMQFADVPADVVLMAVQKLISTNKFPPAISEVKDKLGSIHHEACALLSKGVTPRELTAEERSKYKRIYDVTSPYQLQRTSEPSLYEMLSGGHLLQLGTGSG